jgi:hypothetical protein
MANIQTDIWRLDDNPPNELFQPVRQNAKDAIYRPELLNTIEVSDSAVSLQIG